MVCAEHGLLGSIGAVAVQERAANQILARISDSSSDPSEWLR